jgi:hypothetical protein
MRLSHARRAINARFDDPNLVSCAGRVAVLALADRCGLARLLTDQLTVAAKGGSNAAAKILALVAGMVAGADSITDMDLLRHGGMSRLFAQVRAPSTPHRHWEHSCGCSPSATSANSTRWPPDYWPGWQLRPRSCPTPHNWC